MDALRPISDMEALKSSSSASLLWATHTLSMSKRSFSTLYVRPLIFFRYPTCRVIWGGLWAGVSAIFIKRSSAAWMLLWILFLRLLVSNMLEVSVWFRSARWHCCWSLGLVRHGWLSWKHEVFLGWFWLSAPVDPSGAGLGCTRAWSLLMLVRAPY